MRRLALAAALAAGCTSPRTEVVLGVATDLSARDQIDTVELQVLRDGVAVIDNTWDISGQPAVPTELPGSFGVYSTDGSEPRIDVHVVATRAQAVVVQRDATFSLVKEQTLFMRLGLTSPCQTMTCGPAETCVEGTCKPKKIEARRLPHYTPDQEKFVECDSAAGIIYRDTSTKQPMPHMGSGACDATEDCVEGTCYLPEGGADGGADGGGGDGGGGDGGGPPTGFLLAGTAGGGAMPAGLAAGTIDGNAHLDLVVASTGADNVQVLAGDGTGKFSPFPGSPFTVGTGPSSVSVADFDRDGFLDLAAAEQGGMQVKVLLGDGAGGFGPGTALPLSGPAERMIAADLDGDGWIDLAVTWNGASSGLTIFQNQGGLPVFLSEISPLPQPVRGLAVGELTGDANVDLVVSNGANVSTFAGSGMGLFMTGGFDFAATAPDGVALSDFDGDGVLDLAFADAGAGGSINVARGSPSRSGQFVAPAQTVPMPGAVDLALADFDGDGQPDVAAAAGAGGLALLRGQRGQLSLALVGVQPGIARADRVIALDWNNDSRPDLASSDGVSGSVSILQNSAAPLAGASNFAAAAASAGAKPVDLALGRLDPDGIPDLVVAEFDGHVTVARGDGKGGFLPATRYPVGMEMVRVLLGDLDGDGDTDVVALDATINQIYVLLNAGDGTLGAPVGYVTEVAGRDAVLADFTRDGMLDLAVADGNDVAILGGGAGMFAMLAAVGSSVQPLWVGAGDFDGDGKTDLVAAGVANHNAQFCKGDDTGRFIPGAVLQLGAAPLGLAVADFDEDARLDFAIAGDTGAVITFGGDGAGGFSAPSIWGAASPNGVVAGDFNHDGRVDLLAPLSDSGGGAALLLNMGGGSFGAMDRIGNLTPASAARPADLDRDGKLDVVIVNGSAVQVLLNRTQ